MRAPTRFLFTLTAVALVGGLAAACGDDPAGPVAFEKAAYLRSELGGLPWSETTNEDAMDQAFGAGEWDDLRFETVDVDGLDTLYTFLFLEGSDHGADDMETFITANQAALEAFVSSGRRVLINSAPNEGDGMSFGFGVDLFYDPVDNNTLKDAVEAVNAGHPIFVATDSTEYRGNSFGHALVSGTGLSALIQTAGAPDSVVLAEKSFGRGHALFGGMTTDNFHDPQPEAHTLRINILRYASGVPQP